MSEEAIKQRLIKARKRAINIFREADFEIIPLSDGVFDFQAEAEQVIKKIRIVLDKENDNDIRIVSEKNVPNICKKEIWCAIYGTRKFKKIRIN